LRGNPARAVRAAALPVKTRAPLCFVGRMVFAGWAV